MANPERMREEMIMTIDIPGKQEASPVSDDDSESYCAEVVKAEESVIVAKQAMAADISLHANVRSTISSC
ncbi:hypothetical protein HA466_0275870 [Hirschfeldia incana]|nr:hypothetical protein HA466_0275870 [Hirschfeldia incana]